MAKKRIDQLLVEKGLVESRTLAQEMIKRGQVWIQDQKVITKPGQLLEEDQEIHIEAGEINKYVSRAGLKMESALKKTGLVVQGKRALDVGISTGGFTDCLLQAGCSEVYGVEVGHGQTHEKLLKDKRVHLFEGVNAKNLPQLKDVTSQFPEAGFDILVMDVSFISMTLVLPGVLGFLQKEGDLLSLVKPQFELSPEALSRGGLVKDQKYFVEVENKIRQSLEKLRMKTLDYFPSGIEGKDGNQEFFVWARPL